MRARWRKFSNVRKASILACLVLALFSGVCIVLVATNTVRHSGWLLLPAVFVELAVLIAGPLVSRHEQKRELDEIAARVAAEDQEQES